MTFTVALPLNHPERGLPETDRTQAFDDVAAALRDVSGGPFGPAATRMRLRFRAGTSFPATSLWTGELIPTGEGSLVVTELTPSLTLDLMTLVPPGYPTPRKVITGPLHLDEEINSWFRMSGGSFRVTAGQIIGTPISDTLELGFLDADDLAIDPTWCLHLFDALGVWDLPQQNSNPFQASAALPTSVMVVPREADGSGPGLTLHSSGSHTKMLRPSANLDSALTSFLASDTITIGLQRIDLNTRWRLRVEDITAIPGRAARLTFVGPYASAVEVEFKPQRDLAPLRGQVTGAPRIPLRYRIFIEFEDGRPAPPAVSVAQTLIDVLRQEYEDYGLVVPGHERFGFVPGGWETFEVEGLYQNDAYFGSRLGLDPVGLPLLVEVLGHAFDRQLHPAGLATEDVRRYLSSQLIVSDGYRSPEKNRQLGTASDSPAQHGFHLILRSLADTRFDVVSPALVAAGLEVLEALRTQNPARTFSQLELRLLDGTGAWIWTWRIEPNGVESIPGPFSISPPVEANALLDGREIELFFVPTDQAATLRMPVPQKRGVPVLAGKVSVILYSSDVVGAEKRIPVDDAAHTIRNWLKRAYPEDREPEIAPVENPLQVLERLGAFVGEQRDIRFVFIFSHSTQFTLALLNSTGIEPAQNRWPSRYEHSPVIKERLQNIYGPDIVFGPDDDREFSTRHLRVSHLTKLPPDMRRRLRTNLRESAGVFLVGCKSDLDPSSVLTITEAFATTAGVPVWGANNKSAFYRQEVGGSWSEHTEVQGEGDPNAAPVILLPARPAFKWEGKQIGDVDFIDVYRSSLTKEMPVVED